MKNLLKLQREKPTRLIGGSVTIKSIKAREVLDSRGIPTIEVDLITSFGLSRSSVPAGKSKGKYEALELRDKGKRFFGKGVLQAVSNVNEIIARELKGIDVRQQIKIDKLMLELDGTENKSKLGANTILAVSMACFKAASLAKKLPLYKYVAKFAGNKNLVLPIPSLNIINGGMHAGNNLDIQEFMVLPFANSFREAIRIGTEIYQTLKLIIEKKYGKNAINIGDEGGFAPPLKRTSEALDLITKAIEETGYKKIKLALDCAATSFYKDGKYNFEGEKLNSEGLLAFYFDLIKSYPILSLEDPFAENDWEGFVEITKELGNIMIIGDDLLVTNIKRIDKAVKAKACNGLLLKPNQIGTVTEAIESANFAMRNNFKVMVSHRSGDTCDSFIADLAVGLGTGLIKSGAPCKGERVEKYNQLIRIEEELGKKAKYAGKL